MRKNNLLCTMFAIAALAVLTVLPQALAAEKEAPAQILITSVNVWDGTSNSLKKSVDVLVEGNLIKRIGKIKAPKATIIDGGGRTLMPGLIDMHTHLMFRYGVTVMRNDFDAQAAGAAAMESALLYMQMGYTTVRDVGGNSLGLAKNIAEGRLKIWCCGNAGLTT